ncbi:phosphotransferase [Kribbella sp. NPDC056861]|uniref:phosphotransferase enzyme family protein n=1 Tax=Kribbella sp. NPDC056861 TaxID=3154857 RepID=UPI0034165E6F
MIPTLRSLPDPQALRARLSETYALDFTGCTLLRSLVNDVYELTTPADRYVLKLYRAGGRSAAEIRWETGLSRHLTQAGVPAPVPVALADGTDVGLLDAPEGDRPFVLLEHLTGTKPQPPFDDELYRAFGELMACFHTATDDLQTSRKQPGPDWENLQVPAEENLLRALGDAVRNHLTQYSDALSKGVCHGDVSLDNLLAGPDGLSIHDFDLAGTGYRAADFTGVASTPYWPSFRAGYEALRPIPAADLAAIPYLAVAGSLTNLHFHLVDKPLIRGTESIHEGWAQAELDGLRQAATELL